MVNKGICQACNEVKKLDIHHIDGNHSNDVPENRLNLCSRCHHLAHIELNLLSTGRPGTKPLSERVYDMPPVPFDEIKRQYEACFPRVEARALHNDLT